MKKLILIPILAYIVLIGYASAYPLDVEITPEEISIISDRGINFGVEITNNQDMQDSFTVSVSGPHLLEWKLPGDVLMVVGPGSSRTTYLSFFPKDAEIGEYVYDIKVASYTNPEIELTKQISIKIIPSLSVTEISLDKHEESVDVDIALMSYEKEDVELVINLFFGDRVLQNFVIPIQVDGTATVSKPISIEGFSPGIYTVEALIDGKSMGIERFEVEEIHQVLEKRTTTSGSLYEEVVIEVLNNGNVPEYNYRISEGIRSDFMTGFVTQPESCIESEEGKTCDFVVSRLNPGETASVVYRIEFWPTYAQIAASIIIIIILGIFTFSKFSQPRVKKRHARRTGEHHHIVLEVKNPLFRELKNVIIRDWVSPLASVADEEFQPLKPVVRKSEAGTELVWNLGDMRPREERLLGYRIRPLVKGSLKMPRAHMRYVDNKGKRVNIRSRGLVVE